MCIRSCFTWGQLLCASKTNDGGLRSNCQHSSSRTVVVKTKIKVCRHAELSFLHPHQLNKIVCPAYDRCSFHPSVRIKGRRREHFLFVARTHDLMLTTKTANQAFVRLRWLSRFEPALELPWGAGPYTDFGAGCSSVGLVPSSQLMRGALLET